MSLPDNYVPLTQDEMFVLHAQHQTTQLVFDYIEHCLIVAAKAGRCYVTIKVETVADFCQIGKRMARRHIALLEHLGIIQRSRRIVPMTIAGVGRVAVQVANYITRPRNTAQCLAESIKAFLTKRAARLLSTTHMPDLFEVAPRPVEDGWQSDLAARLAAKWAAEEQAAEARNTAFVRPRAFDSTISRTLSSIVRPETGPDGDGG